MKVGEANVINEPLVAREKFVIPSLRIKLGLMKQFVKTLPVTLDCFNYICRAFPALTIKKLKAEIFDGSQIRTFIKDPCFVHSMTGTESAAWQLFVFVTQNFLGTKLKIAKSWWKICFPSRDGQFRIPNPKDSNPKCQFKPDSRIRFISCLQALLGCIVTDFLFVKASIACNDSKTNSRTQANA